MLGFRSQSSEEDSEDGLEDDEDFDDTSIVGQTASSKKPSNSRRRDASSPDSIMGHGEDSKEEEMEGWGSSKKDYYNADVIETEADALEEEEEAKNIQMRKLQSMAETDFAFDETEWAMAGKAENKEDAGNITTEVLPGLQISEDMSGAERLKILKQRYPEFEPLSKDFIDLHSQYEELAAAAKSTKTNNNSPNPSQSLDFIPVEVVKFRALSAYLGAISMYFFILTSPSRNGVQCLALPPAELREHAIMETLVHCRKQWERARNLQSPESFDFESDSSDVIQVEETSVSRQSPQATELVRKSSPDANRPRKSAQKKTRAEKAAEKDKALAENHRAQRLRQTEDGLAELSKLIENDSPKKTKPKFSKSTAKNQDDDSDFGDETGLTTQEAEEKAKRKKSLRFYTSQIAQKANKRDAAGRDAGGDADLPYRERLKDRQIRLNLEAEKRGRQQANEAEQLGGDSDDEDHRVAKELRNEQDGTDDDEYYDMVAARSKGKKEAKKKLAEAHAEAARQGGYVEEQEEIGPDGKRAITYAIEKNKGLTPKRSKDVRNPRVKKRKKFDEKKKKLGSIRQIYKGGEGRGGYGGELTGIKKNLVKSVKL